MKNDERNWRKKQFENHNILNNKQKEEIKKAFDMFDGNGSGIIEASNLKGNSIIIKYKQNVSKHIIYKIQRKLLF